MSASLGLLPAARATAPTPRGTRAPCRPASLRRRAAAVAAAAGGNGGGGSSAVQELTLHLGECTVAFPFSIARAQELDAALLDVMSEFRARETWERPRRLRMMEFSAAGESAAAPSVEIVCNPNAYPTAFTAKALVTLTAGGVRVTAEGGLTAVVQDLEAFKNASAK